ncbi:MULTISPECIES: chaperone modulator CbpM [Alteromonas]|jgi:chaperone modulatory protein CbpM|uniref:Chaperone modulator CbpM n=1 Tax=Alteromonas stellipolaris TaxID=233316 RepID=A0AAW7Z8A0_9ALTE|nr:MULTISPECIES: chaperone modulator CbpM [Alteromonas]AMJ91577.1 chaperone modulatory protein CbpM [Alteromonas sp. Mac2]ALM89596.1 Chaperone-modulator protein CbpM [Alteromonas stellipolaris LMG 21856]AMJ75300.1 chaperone modulatory protein CbpM [Alteromonas stellipolaris]AMJ87713.1 chaperone modulatory protein CbpM [Alteromonas sp. Mac1]AMJ95436.1 chaperone modulatory protein CbpM [Alteromonas stellipolaris]
MSETLLIISFEELCHIEQLSKDMIIEVIDYGIAEPVSGDNTRNWVFDTNSVRWVKKAITLYSQLELDWIAVAMIVELLKQKEKLTEENENLQRRLMRF